MLTVVLSILKWIGITILILLGILIFLLCLLLFVPIRYKADGSFKDSYKVQARASWLLHMVSFSLEYGKEQSLHIKLRIFGIPVFDNLKKRNKTRKTTRIQTSPEIVGASAVRHTEKETPRTEEQVEDGKIPDRTDRLADKAQKKHVFSKAIGIFRNIKYTIYRICDTIKKIRDNITYYIELLKKESTRAALSACKKQFLRIFKNLKPQKYQVNLHIGMEDPAVMGDILGIWGMLYPIHQGYVDICPDFEQVVLEGDFYCKGRVTVYVYIWTVIIVVFDKDIRRLRQCLMRKGK